MEKSFCHGSRLDQRRAANLQKIGTSTKLWHWEGNHRVYWMKTVWYHKKNSKSYGSNLGNCNNLQISVDSFKPKAWKVSLRMCPAYLGSIWIYLLSWAARGKKLFLYGQTWGHRNKLMNEYQVLVAQYSMATMPSVAQLEWILLFTSAKKVTQHLPIA